MHNLWLPAYSIYLVVKHHEDGDVGRMKHNGYISGEQGIWGLGNQGDFLSGSVGESKIVGVVHTKIFVDT